MQHLVDQYYTDTRHKDMHLKTVCILVLSALLVIMVIRISNIPQYISFSSNNLPQHSGQGTCYNEEWDSQQLVGYSDSVAVIYDFTSITPTQLQDDVNSLLTNLNPSFVAHVILVENKCENEQTVAAALSLAQSNSKVKVVMIDAQEIVSTSRARIEGVKKTSAPLLLFISAGTVPTSNNFLENMLHVIEKNPETVVCPSSEDGRISHLTWNLNIKASTDESSVQTKMLGLPLLNDSAFLIRTDLYKAVGGYDSYFFKRDSAHRVAFSLSIWTCGGTIIQTPCSTVKHLESSPVHSEVQSITYIQHAKYIQEVYGGGVSLLITFPGVSFYKMSAYDQHAIKERKKVFNGLNCLTMEWYAHKFPAGLPLTNLNSKLYQPDYQPLLPVYSRKQHQLGKWFVLYAGHCVKVDDDFILGLSWCPVSLPANYKFLWQDSGQILSGDKCVTVRSDDFILSVEECKKGGDSSQLFSYDTSTKQVISKLNGECVTHYSGPNSRQVLRTMQCAGNAPFNKFIINDVY